MKSITKSAWGVYELFMLCLCVYVLVALGAETLFNLNEDTVDILRYIDTGVCVLFLADFVIKLTVARNKLAYLKWGWIDLLSSIPTIGPLRLGRLARVFRILRLLRGLRASKSLAEYLLAHRAESTFMTAALLALLVVVFSSIAVLNVEKGIENATIRTAGDAVWWAFVTVTTVGYGDKFPVSSAGRAVAAVAMTAGVGLFGTFTGFVASWFLSPGEAEQESELEAIRCRLDKIEQHLESLTAIYRQDCEDA